MTLALAVALLFSQTAPTPPPGLQFAYHRLAGMQQRVKDLRCGGAFELNRDLELTRRRLAGRYGRVAFARPTIARSDAPGNCAATLSTYRANLADFRRQADTILAVPIARPVDR